jgi:hypothetical protein
MHRFLREAQLDAWTALTATSSDNRPQINSRGKRTHNLRATQMAIPKSHAPVLLLKSVALPRVLEHHTS